MIVACPKCHARYDDLYRWTICPHLPLEVGHVPYHPINNRLGYCRSCDLIGPHLCSVFGAVVPATGAGLSSNVVVVELAGDGKRTRRRPWWKDCETLGHGDPIRPVLIDREERSITYLAARCVHCNLEGDAYDAPVPALPRWPWDRTPVADVTLGSYLHLEPVERPHPFMSYMVWSDWPWGQKHIVNELRMGSRIPPPSRDRDECPDCLKVNGGRPGGIIVCDTAKHPLTAGTRQP